MLKDGSCHNSYINKSQHLTAAVTTPYIIFQLWAGEAQLSEVM